MQNFEDRVAVVTGGASGIGLALGKAFTGLGMHVVLADVQARPLDEAVATLGERASGVVTDVADAGSVEALADAAYDRHGAVHVLCNNAGVTVRTSLLDATRADWEWVLGVNLWGAINGIDAFVPRMVAAGTEGHIVNTCSMAGFLAAARYAIYCATKHAVVAITESLAGDLAEAGAPIGVTAVCPSAVATDFVHAERTRPDRYGGPAVTAAGAEEQARLEAVRDAAQSPEEIAHAVVAGIRAGELFVFPDEAAKAPAAARMHRILS